LQRRKFLLSAAAALAGAVLPRAATANVPKPSSFDTFPPTNSRDAFVSWMQANRGENPTFLGERWSRYEALLRNRDL